MTDGEIITQTENVKLSTDKEKFTPTPTMVLWLDVAIRLESDNPTEIAENCEPKIHRTNWYNWLDKTGFIEWYNEEWNKRIKGHAWRLDVIGFKNSKKDFNYWKAMQQRVGNLKENSTTITGDKVIAILGDITAK